MITPAKRGDLAIIRRIGDGSGSMRVEPLVRWYVGRVTRVDRSGLVREFEYPAIGGLQRQEVHTGRGWGGGLDPNGAFVASARDVDVEATLEAARAHTYEGHPQQPKPFDTLDDVKAIVVLATSCRVGRKEGRSRG